MQDYNQRSIIYEWQETFSALTPIHVKMSNVKIRKWFIAFSQDILKETLH